MRFFLDTSSLVKLYHTEDGSTTLRAQLQNIDILVVAELTWVEAHSAFGRKVRRGELTQEQALISVNFLAQDWLQLKRQALTTAVLVKAAQLVTKHNRLALRALDAIQLAAALAGPALDGFFTHDQRLREAAAAEGLPIR